MKPKHLEEFEQLNRDERSNKEIEQTLGITKHERWDLESYVKYDFYYDLNDRQKFEHESAK